MFFSRKREEKNEAKAKAEAVAPATQMDQIRDQIVQQLPPHLRERIEAGEGKVGVHAISVENPSESVQTGIGLVISGMMSSLMAGGNLGVEGAALARAINGVARVSPQVADAIIKSVIVGICSSARMTPKAFLEMISENAPDEEWDGGPVDTSPEEDLPSDDVKELEDLFNLPPIERDDDGR